MILEAKLMCAMWLIHRLQSVKGVIFQRLKLIGLISCTIVKIKDTEITWIKGLSRGQTSI